MIKWKIWGSRWLLACGGNIYCHNCRYCGYGASEYEDHLQWYSNNSPEALKSERIAMGVTSGSHFQSYIFSTLQSSLGTMYPSILYPYYVWLWLFYQYFFIRNVLLVFTSSHLEIQSYPTIAPQHLFNLDVIIFLKDVLSFYRLLPWYQRDITAI